MPNPQVPLVIALSGFPGSGKDTVAAILNLLGYAPLSLAAQLRHEIHDFATKPSPGPLSEDDIAIAAAAMRDPDLEIAIRQLESNPATLWAKPTSWPIRRLLQWWGTDFRRKANPDYWVTKFITETYPSAQQVLAGSFAHYFPATKLSHPLPVVLTDTRFGNEYDMARELAGPENFQHWRILRPDCCDRATTRHASEQEHPTWRADRVIHNTGTLLDLNHKVQEALYGEGQIPPPQIWSSYWRADWLRNSINRAMFQFEQAMADSPDPVQSKSER